MSMFEELKRRNVFRVGIAYGIMSWLLLQAADFALDLIGAPNWVIQSLFVVVVLGFLVALFFAWAFELTPEGLKRESEVDRSASVTNTTRRKLDVAIMGSLLLVAAFFFWESRFKAQQDTGGPAVTQTSADETEIDSADALATAQDASDDLPKDTIAVLPFANRSNLDDDLFFTDGIHDDLLTQLAKIENLKVISRTSVMTYRNTEKRIPEIARDLGAGIILEGGVQRAGDRIRINAQLIDVSTDQHLWADTFDREMTIDNLFDIQSEISRQIVTAVKGEVTEKDVRSLSNRPTDSLAAWEAYIRAQAILSETDYMESKYDRAEPLVKLAIEEDPEFAEAWVMLAEIQLQGIWWGNNNTQAQRELALTTIEKAKALSPDSPAVIAAQAEYEYRVNNDYQSSLDLTDKAIELSPSSVSYYQHRGLSLRRLGRWEESINAFDDAIQLDPLDSYAAATKAETLATMREWDRLETLLDRWLVVAPDSYDLLTWKFYLEISARGDLEAAQAVLQQGQLMQGTRLVEQYAEFARLNRDWEQLVTLVKEPEMSSFMPVRDLKDDYRIGVTYALVGQPESARELLERYTAESTEDEKQGNIAQSLQAINVAESLALLGRHEAALERAAFAETTMNSDIDTLFGGIIEDRAIYIRALAGQRDEALAALAVALEEPGYMTRWYLYLDPLWDFFRDDPRFNDLIRPEGVEPDPFYERARGERT